MSKTSGTFTRREMLRGLGALGATAAAGGLLAACSSSPSSTPASGSSAGGAASTAVGRGGTLRLGMTGGSSSDTLSPLLGGLTAIGTARLQQLYQPLVQLGNDAQVEYVLAESIEPHGDTSTWRIHLNSGIEFHNGKSFGADDVIYTLQQILDPKDPKGGAMVLAPVDVANLKKIDPLTVEVPMTQPFGTFVDQMAAFWYFLYVAPNGWKEGDAANGTGPFKYESFTPGQQSLFTRNDKYWGRKPPILDSVSIVNFQDPTAVVNALTSGSIDCTGQLTGAQINILKKNSSITTVPSKTGSIEPFTMRTDIAPFNDVNVRQAMRLLVDRQAFVDTVFNSYAWVASDVTSPYDPNFDASLVRERDLDQARSLLKKAGYDNDFKVSLASSVGVNSSAIGMATLLKEHAAEAGVTINIEQVPPDTYFGPNYYTKVPFGQIYYNYSPYLAQVSQTFLPTSPFPEVHFNNEQYTKLYNEANATTDKDKLKDICFQMQKIDFDEGGYLIPCFVDSLDAYRSSVKGYKSGKVGEPLGNFDFTEVTMG